MLRELQGRKRLRFNHDQRRRLAAKGHALGRRVLRGLSICPLLLACGGEDAMEPLLPTPPTFTVVGRGTVTAQWTSDLWVHGTVAYTGTTSDSLTHYEGDNLNLLGSRAVGNTLWVWDVSNPARPVRAGSVVVDAGAINDVKIRADGTLGVITLQDSRDGRMGITLLDLSDPLRPRVITRYTLRAHNVWIEGDYVYATGSIAHAHPEFTDALTIIDISNPADPQIVARFYAGSSSARDVYVRDGLAFVSHWDAGLVILDVGHGIAGGSPTNPVEVGRVEGGGTHNAWYWPDAGYVFVGAGGVLHVVDVSDLSNPVEVATFEISEPGGDPHNFWLDEARGILYVAWWNQGLKAIDVSGELLGRLDQQGRLVGSIELRDAPLLFNGGSFGVQLHNGLVYLSEVDSGLWIFRPEF